MNHLPICEATGHDLLNNEKARSIKTLLALRMVPRILWTRDSLCRRRDQFDNLIWFGNHRHVT